MRICQLGNTGLFASVLGFGCSAIMGRAGRTQSLRALSAAWDAGITFYDTARSYGYGEAETLLGEFLRGRRERAIISTKFGILASRQPLWKRAAKPIVRGLLSAVPAARGAVRKRTASEFVRNEFTVQLLEQSLNESLRSLKADYVDLLFMHEAPESVLHQEELLLALEKLVSSGKVRVVGISAAPEVIVAALQQPSLPLRAAQFASNCFDLSATGAGSAVKSAGWAGVANQPFGGVTGVQTCRSILAEIAAGAKSAAQAPAELLEKLSELRGTLFSDAVLNLVLRSPGVHVVIPAMMQVAHIRDNVNAISNTQFSATELDWMRSAIALQAHAARAIPA